MSIFFPHCPERIGLYPIVDRAHWLEKLLPLGVKTIQLRIKDLTGTQLENEIHNSIAIAQHYKAHLFINDYWQLAIRFKAYGVHLGQEDLGSANIDIIAKAGLRLGISTHSQQEVDIACDFNPSYIACGPIFPTTSKIMPFEPQGIAGLQYWQKTLPYPLVAIGGITLERFADVVATGVSGIAMISAITQAQDPIATTQQFLAMLN